MDHRTHEPSDLADIDCVPDDGGWTLVLPWDLPASPDTVWTLLTDATLLARWSPFASEANLGDPCPGDGNREVGARIHWDGGHHDLQLRVVGAEPAVRLEYTVTDDRLLWTLTPIDGGTRVTLRHTFAAWDWAGDVAAHWHLCLTRAAGLLEAGLLDDDPAPDHGCADVTNRRRRDLSWSYQRMLVFAGWLELDPKVEPAPCERAPSPMTEVGDTARY